MAAELSWWKNHVDPDLARGPAVLGPDLGDLDPAPVDPGLGRTDPEANPRAEDRDPDPVHNPLAVIGTVTDTSAVLVIVLDPEQNSSQLMTKQRQSESPFKCCTL